MPHEDVRQAVGMWYACVAVGAVSFCGPVREVPAHGLTLRYALLLGFPPLAGVAGFAGGVVAVAMAGHEVLLQLGPRRA